jgi:outer membrane protein assembly factor BamB
MPLLTALTLVALLATAADSQWPQWGGPRRDFQAADVELDASWPESGPPRLWMRTLGEGYSAIAVVDGVLFTMYRRDDDTEVVVAIDAASGETRWEHAYEGSISGLNTGYGDGPHSTPLIHAGAVYTVGVRSLLLCLDAETGERRWSRDLWGEFDAEPRRRGFASSPVVYQELLILPVGGDDGHGVMAFDLDTGAVAWKSQDVGPTFSSPILIDVDGQDQLVSFGSTDIIGLDPASGERLWSHPHPTQYNVNAATPVWGAGQLLFTSSAYDAAAASFGCSVLKGERRPRSCGTTAP